MYQKNLIAILSYSFFQFHSTIVIYNSNVFLSPFSIIKVKLIIIVIMIIIIKIMLQSAYEASYHYLFKWMGGCNAWQTLIQLS